MMDAFNWKMKTIFQSTPCLDESHDEGIRGKESGGQCPKGLARFSSPLPVFWRKSSASARCPNPYSTKVAVIRSEVLEGAVDVTSIAVLGAAVAKKRKAAPSQPRTRVLDRNGQRDVRNLTICQKTVVNGTSLPFSHVRLFVGTLEMTGPGKKASPRQFPYTCSCAGAVRLGKLDCAKARMLLRIRMSLAFALQVLVGAGIDVEIVNSDVFFVGPAYLRGTLSFGCQVYESILRAASESGSSFPPVASSRSGAQTSGSVREPAFVALTKGKYNRVLHC